MNQKAHVLEIALFAVAVLAVMLLFVLLGQLGARRELRRHSARTRRADTAGSAGAEAPVTVGSVGATDGATSHSGNGNSNGSGGARSDPATGGEPAVGASPPVAAVASPGRNGVALKERPSPAPPATDSASAGTAPPAPEEQVAQVAVTPNGTGPVQDAAGDRAPAAGRSPVGATDAVDPATLRGWHPDPGGLPDVVRYWDGARWTSYFARRLAP